MAKEITEAVFNEEIAGKPGKVLLDFWAPWCMPCQMIAPVIEELASELDGQVLVGKVNVDEQPALAAKFGVMSIPMLAVLENGELATQAVGVRPKADIMQLLKL